MDAYTQPKRALSGGFDTCVIVTTAGTTQTLVAAKQTTPSDLPVQHTIHVQRLRIVVRTGSDGKTLTIQDSAGSPVVIAGPFDMSVAGVEYEVDFGPQGRALTTNKDLKASISAAGAAFDVYIEGFQERKSVFIPTYVSVSPVSGAAAGGTDVVVYGTGFGPHATLTFGGVAATSVRVSPDGQSIYCKTPAHAAGAVDIVVTNVDLSAVTGAGAFTYV